MIGILLFSEEALGLPKKIDATMFELSNVRADVGVVIFLLMMILIISLAMPAYRYFQSLKIGKEVEQYQKKKALHKMSSMNASEAVSKALITIAGEVEQPPEDLLADNELFEKSLETFRQMYPTHPYVRNAQKMRAELNFVFGNPKAKFVVSQMLQSKQKIRVFANMEGRHMSFVTQVIRGSDKQLWLVPPKVKGKVFDISKFDELTIKVNHPGDGDYQFTTRLRAQVNRPVDALVLDQTDRIERLDPSRMAQCHHDFEQKFVFMVEKMEEITIFKKYDSFPAMATILGMSPDSLEVASESIPKEVYEGCIVLFKLKNVGIDEKITGKVFSLKSKKGVTYLKIQIIKLSEKGRLMLEKYIIKKTKEGSR